MAKSLPEIEAAVAQLQTAVAQIQQQLGALPAMQTALTQAQAQLAQAVADFTPVAGRVTELSAAFQDANGRLSAAEATLVGLSTDGQLDQLISKVNAAVETVEGFSVRLTTLENTRARSGRLNNRLSNIEASLQQIIDNQTGGNT